MVEKNRQNAMGVFPFVTGIRFGWRGHNLSNTNTVSLSIGFLALLSMMIGVIIGYTLNVFRHDVFSNVWRLVDKHYYGAMPSDEAITLASLESLGRWTYPDGSMGNVSAIMDTEGLCVK